MAENDKLLGVHVAEDDDTQRIRAWWKKNGMGIVAGVAIGLVGVGGFKGWQAYTEDRALSASDVFQQMLACKAGDKKRRAFECHGSTNPRYDKVKGSSDASARSASAISSDIVGW